MRSFTDLTGKKFGRLLVINKIQRPFLKRTAWECLCVCGNLKLIKRSEHLLKGMVKSCGCLNSEKTSERNRTHGMSKTRFYHIWHGIQKRCNDPKDNVYKKYGARGIKCEWKNFNQFYQDMFFPYEKHVVKYGEKRTSIDRIDNDGNYSKKNCRWATPEIQQRNSRHARFITFHGRRECITDWGKILDLDYGTITNRMDKLNWNIQDALTLPIDNRPRKFRLSDRISVEKLLDQSH